MGGFFCEEAIIHLRSLVVRHNPQDCMRGGPGWWRAPTLSLHFSTYWMLYISILYHSIWFYLYCKNVPYLEICIYLHVFLMMCLLRAALQHKKLSQLPFSNQEDGRKKGNNLNKYKNKYCWDIAFYWVFNLQFTPKYSLIDQGTWNPFVSKYFVHLIWTYCYLLVKNVDDFSTWKQKFFRELYLHV